MGSPGCDAIWAIPSSNTNETESLKELAKKRIALRNDASFAPTFDDFLKIRSSCWLVERRGGEYYCDCYNGIKGRLCKHAIGIMYKTGDLMVTEDVRSKPLGQKRRKGRPPNLPKNSCRVNSPPPPPVIPMASYHPASPELRTLSPVGPGSAFSGVRSQPTPSTPVLASRRPADQYFCSVEHLFWLGHSPLIIISFLCHLLCLVAVLAPFGLNINAM